MFCLAFAYRWRVVGEYIFDDASLLPFEGKKDELSIHYGCILRGTRVIIHAKGRELVMDMLHQGGGGGGGISRMQSIARG